MKFNFSGFFLFFVLLVGCQKNQSITEENIISKSLVETSSIKYGGMQDEVTLQATSLYLRKNVVTAPVPCFVVRVNIKLGDQVNTGMTLFDLITKEGRALANQPVMGDSSLKNFGNIRVRANSQGIISTLDRQQGDYVLEGSPLCTIAESKNLAFQVNVPFEYNQYIKDGTQCEIVLPDNRRLKGVVSATLTTMNSIAQTQQFIIKPLTNFLIPEGLIVNVLITTAKRNNVQVLPKSCILSDEIMENFWVMKLINDSTAVKISIKPGLKTDSTMEIKQPTFKTSDLFLSKGNYGLADTALVNVVKK